MPALLRSFGAGQTDEAEWAGYLLRRIGGARVLGKLNAMLRDPGVGDEVKARALGLLADLKAPAPQQVVLRDPDALLQASVRELLSSMGSRSEITQAVEMVLDQVPGGEIGTFVREVIDHGGGAAAPLIRGLIADPRTPSQAVHDLSGLMDRELRPLTSRDVHSLEGALNHLQAGKPQRARRALTQLATAYPNDAEVRSALGVCLIELGSAEEAMLHLQRAADLEPHAALHLWNLAAASRAADQMGICYKALQGYVLVPDSSDGAAARRREAQAFCEAYEAMLQDAYPGIPLDQVLMGEEMFARAYAALSASRYDEAMLRFREVLNLVPRHYPSWGNLGAAYLAMDRTEEAMHCLQRALELNPNYTIARENLALIEHR